MFTQWIESSVYILYSEDVLMQRRSDTYSDKALFNTNNNNITNRSFAHILYKSKFDNGDLENIFIVFYEKYLLKKFYEK